MSDKLKIMQSPRTSRGNRRRSRSSSTATMPTSPRDDQPTANDIAAWGIDVSHYQGVIDWKKVRSAGCQFAFLKATEGASMIDNTFKRNREEARANGIITGAYHFFRTRILLEAQLDNFANTIGQVDFGELSPVLDVEIPSQWATLSVEARNQMVRGFVEGVRSRLGRHIQPFIYLSPSFADDILKNESRLALNPLWLAHYTSAAQPRTPKPWTKWTFWQWTERGTVAGVNTPVDMNRFNGTEIELRELTIDEELRAPVIQ